MTIEIKQFEVSQKWWVVRVDGKWIQSIALRELKTFHYNSNDEQFFEVKPFIMLYDLVDGVVKSHHKRSLEIDSKQPTDKELLKLVKLDRISNL